VTAANVQKIRPFLWFDDSAEEAMNFYLSIFKNGETLQVSRDDDTGKVMSVTFRLEGQEFLAFNGGPHFRFTEAISFFIDCESQDEVDELWERLSKGGEESRCGWLKDKFGLSWQVIPSTLMELLGDPDPQKSERVWQAMMQMGKIDIARLQAAYAG
jgi:predicted 3-demethylubiquinone-9 3-methyltransferase (glyoxalase superfamily)